MAEQEEKKKYVIIGSKGSNHPLGEDTLSCATTMLAGIRSRDASAKLAEITDKGAIVIDV